MTEEITQMTNELSNLQQQIQEALQLLQESKVFTPRQESDARGVLPASDVFFTEHSSLLDKLAQVCAQYQEQKPTIRIIHHLACSGGTLISKCLSAMPNVYLLSEVHPYTNLHLGTGKPKFSPTDISSLSKYAGIPSIKMLRKELFLQNIITTHKHVASYGGTLILRDHTHSDFHVDSTTTEQPSVIDALSDVFTIKSVITFRDPVDSYLSLQQNKWAHFSPGTFEEYCSRIIKMLTAYKDVKLFHYEDFVEKPVFLLQEICAEMQIQYVDNWQLYFDVAQVTGDSGRSSVTIEARPRRDLSTEMLNEIADSESYANIKVLLHETNNPDVR
jgi:hypothetical protein